MWTLLENNSDFNNIVSNIVSMKNSYLKIIFKVGIRVWLIFSAIFGVLNIIGGLVEKSTLLDIFSNIFFVAIVVAFPVFALCTFIFLAIKAEVNSFDKRWLGNTKVYYIKGYVKKKVRHRRKNKKDSIYYIIQAGDLEYTVDAIYTNKDSLANEGINVIIFADGAEAIKSFQKESRGYFCCELGSFVRQEYYP